MSVAAQLAPAPVARGTARVGVIGSGAIGAAVIRELARDAVAGAELVAVVDRSPVPDCRVRQVPLAEALQRCDVLVECAGQDFVSAHAAEILGAGVDLLVTSVGALADPEVAELVLAAGPGRLLITAGAVGGIDLLASAAAHAPLRSVRVTTAKLPRTLLQPWMDEPTRHRIAEATEPVEVFRGGARDAARWFPRSLNVAATVAFVVGGFDAVEVVLVADPGAELTAHVIEADGDAGQYRFEIRNQPSPDNPRTSGIGGRKPAEPAKPAGRVGRVPFAVLRSLSVLVGRPVRIV